MKVVADDMAPVTSAERCREVLAGAFPDLSLGSVRFLAEGWDSSVFEVDGTLVFRFPKRAAVDETIQKEIRLLPALGPVLPLPVPRFDYVSGPVLDHPWHVVGYRKLPGRPLSDVHLTPAVVAVVAPALAGFLRALHGFPVDEAVRLGVPAVGPEARFAQYQDLAWRARKVVEDRLDGDRLDRFDRYWEGFFANQAERRFAPALVHGDLNIEHVLVDDGGRVGGVIDFGDAAVADPALDFAGFPDPLVRAVLAPYGPPPDAAWWARREAYRRAGPLHAIAAGTELGRPELVEDGLARLRRQLDGEPG